MDLPAAAAAAFPIVLLGELPDKTMLASVLLSSRGHGRAVWLGAACAFVVHVAIAVTVGAALVRFLPRRALDVTIAVVFGIGAVLAVREALEHDTHVSRVPRSHRHAFAASFVVIFLAEWGDLTQVLTANLAARTHAPIGVGIGAVAALLLASGLAVAGGRRLARWTGARWLAFVTAGVCAALCVATAVAAA